MTVAAILALHSRAKAIQLGDEVLKMNSVFGAECHPIKFKLASVCIAHYCSDVLFLLLLFVREASDSPPDTLRKPLHETASRNIPFPNVQPLNTYAVNMRRSALISIM